MKKLILLILLLFILVGCAIRINLEDVALKTARLHYDQTETSHNVETIINTITYTIIKVTFTAEQHNVDVKTYFIMIRHNIDKTQIYEIKIERSL